MAVGKKRLQAPLRFRSPRVHDSPQTVRSRHSPERSLCLAAEWPAKMPVRRLALEIPALSRSAKDPSPAKPARSAFAARPSGTRCRTAQLDRPAPDRPAPPALHAASVAAVAERSVPWQAARRAADAATPAPGFQPAHSVARGVPACSVAARHCRAAHPRARRRSAHLERTRRHRRAQHWSRCRIVRPSKQASPHVPELQSLLYQWQSVRQIKRLPQHGSNAC